MKYDLPYYEKLYHIFLNSIIMMSNEMIIERGVLTFDYTTLGIKYCIFATSSRISQFYFDFHNFGMVIHSHRNHLLGCHFFFHFKSYHSNILFKLYLRLLFQTQSTDSFSFPLEPSNDIFLHTFT